MHDLDEHRLTEREAQLTARILVAEYGNEAEEVAEARQQEMLSTGNEPAAGAWERVLHAVQDMRTE